MHSLSGTAVQRRSLQASSPKLNHLCFKCQYRDCLSGTKRDQTRALILKLGSRCSRDWALRGHIAHSVAELHTCMRSACHGCRASRGCFHGNPWPEPVEAAGQRNHCQTGTDVFIHIMATYRPCRMSRSFEASIVGAYTFICHGRLSAGSLRARGDFGLAKQDDALVCTPL